MGIDDGCERLIRLGPAGAKAVAAPGLNSSVVAADSVGGLWFSTTDTAPLDHVDAGGTLRDFFRN